ncbi:hypothetical protein EGM51_10725 [Verrucomicrobia bacterium S94]|nr:hypothetical protein EGM51_10725 [Verrucomicrobia bacterium S94]
MNSPATLSTTDIDEMAQLPLEVRDEIFELIAVCEQIDAAASVSAGIREARANGYKESTIKRKYYRWKKFGWRGLVNNAKVGKQKAAIDIGDVYKSYCEQNQRSSREAWRQMMRDFRNGKLFPEVGTWREVWAAEHPDIATPERCPNDYTPRGWTYSNLQKSCGLSKYEIFASRIGRGRAKDLLPSVYSTRVGLQVGAIYMFDDMWWDMKVNYPGNARAQRVIELAAVDVASACRFAWGAKPRREDLDTGKMKNLNECDMRQMLAHVLINVGFHPDGCRLIVEHGTAAASDDLEGLIGRLSQGRVTFERSGIISAPVHKGLYCGQPRGNYKRKAALESQHSLCHTVAAALQGQIGKDRDHAPEHMYGLEQYNTSLLKVAAALPPERAKLLMMPVLDFNRAVAVMGDLYREMNLRTWHNLEGWEECGYTATEFRLSPMSDEWLPMESITDLPADEYLMIYNAIHSMPEKLSRTVNLSPQHVFDSGRSDFVRLPKSCMPQILGNRLAVMKTIREDGLITYSNQEFGPNEFRYLARSVRDVNGFSIALNPGRKVAVHINPFNTDECFISDPDSGAYIGLAERWQTVGKLDVEALERQAGRQAKIESKLRAPMARRGAKIIKERTEMLRNNLSVMRGEPITEEDKSELVRIRKNKESADSFLTEPDPDMLAEEMTIDDSGEGFCDIFGSEFDN